MKKIIVSLLALVYVFSGEVLAIEWEGTVDSDWYNSANWAPESVPGSSDGIAWRYAAVDHATYSPIVISGGTATSGTSICDIWYQGTATLTVTNAATYNITGYLAVRNGAADDTRSPANAEFIVEAGSSVNISGDAFIGRKLISGSSAYGLCKLTVNGENTVYNQGGYMWLGNGNNATVETRVDITNGAVVNINVTGGLRFQPDTTNGVYPVVNIDGGFLNIKGNRTGEVADWIANNYLIAMDDEGTIEYSYDDVSGYTNISSVAPLIPPVVSGTFVTAFLDDFDSYLPNTMWCGDPIILATPKVGLEWKNMAVSNYGAVWDCDFGVSDSNSLSIVRPTSGDTIDIYAYPKPLMIHSEGFTYRFEHDVYIPTGGQARFFANCDSKNIGYHAFTNFRIADGVNPSIDTGVAVPYDQWVHIRVDVYEDNTVWMWYTPEGGEEQIIVGDLAWNIGYGTAGAGKPMRSHVDGVSWGTPAVNFDNYKAIIIDNTPQGYPVIAPATSSITIDGNVDIESEWNGAKKVAYKPVDSKGNFNPVMAANYWQGLSDSTTVDVYMSYDEDYFYIAFDGTNMTSGLPASTDNGRTETVFTFDYQDVSPTVSYVFTTYADAASSEIDSTGTQVGKSTGYAAVQLVDYSSFTQAGGLMKYTVNNGRMQSEFRIPLAFMPEITSIQSGETLNVQFNYVEIADGDHRATTNSIGSFVPDLIYGAGTRLAPLAAGITFPIEGDFNADCIINTDDLITFSQYWLANSSIADFNDDGIVDFEDFAIIGTNWLIEGLCD